MNKPHRNDISIGKNQWITSIEFDTGKTHAVDLDGLLTPISSFLDSLETHCVADCCGINAYALWPEEIVKAARESEIPHLPEVIGDVRKRIVKTEGEVFFSHRMNNYFHRKTFQE